MGTGTSFSEWLTAELARQDLSLRGLARRIADAEVTTSVESIRRTLNKYVHEGRVPGESMKRAIAAALGVDRDDIPDEDDDEAALQALMRDPDFMRKLRPVVKLIAGFA